VRALCELDVVAGIPNVRFAKRRIAGIREHLVDAAAGHDIAGQK
jgi:hypothetical protein